MITNCEHTVQDVATRNKFHGDPAPLLQGKAIINAPIRHERMISPFTRVVANRYYNIEKDNMMVNQSMITKIASETIVRHQE